MMTQDPDRSVLEQLEDAGIVSFDLIAGDEVLAVSERVNTEKAVHLTKPMVARMLLELKELHKAMNA